MSAKAQGKPSTFSEAQNKLLRLALGKILKDVPQKDRSGQRVGAWLGVGQQTASRYLSGRAGFGYEAAMLIARAVGHATLDEFFEAHDALLSPPDLHDTNLWRSRDMAVNQVRRAGVSETAIRRVIMRYAEGRYKTQPPKWWDERFRIEHEDEIARAGAAATNEAAEKIRAKRESKAEKPTIEAGQHQPKRTKRVG